MNKAKPGTKMSKKWLKLGIRDPKSNKNLRHLTVRQSSKAASKTFK